MVLFGRPSSARPCNPASSLQLLREAGTSDREAWAPGPGQCSVISLVGGPRGKSHQPPASPPSSLRSARIRALRARHKLSARAGHQTRALILRGPGLAQRDARQGPAGEALKPLPGSWAGCTPHSPATSPPAPQHLWGPLAKGAGQLSGKHLTTVRS